MSKYSKPARLALGSTVALGLLLGTACGGGGGGDKPVQAASIADAAPAPAEPPTTEAPATTVPPTVAPSTTVRAAASRSSTPATPAAPASTAVTAPPATAAPATAPLTAPTATIPARPNPSTPEVLGAISQFRTRVPFFSPTEAQAREFGDMVCDAFDAGQTYAQVKSAALAQVAAVPFISISSADADFILRIAVKLFCPSYASKLPA